MIQNIPCRSCGAHALHPLLSLGAMPLANALPFADAVEVEARFPLDLALCRGCGLVQITETVPPERLFDAHPYFSSVSETMVEHACCLVERLAAERRLGADDLVVEIGSNDGYLLQFYQARGIPVLGIEPNLTVAEAAQRGRGIPTLTRFFTSELADELARNGRRATILHAHNVFAHIPRPRDFARALKQVLHPDGMAVIEVPYVKDLIDGGEFDTIYHEHFCYFSLTALAPIWAAAGLMLADVERIDIHCGSLRLFVVAENSRDPSPRVGALLAEEAGWGAADPNYYASLAASVAALSADLRAVLFDLKRQGKTVAGYGASAKATILLNYFGIGRDLLDFVVDRAPTKQGRRIPGTRIPILPPDTLAERRPDYLLLLVRNIAAEILAQQEAYRRGGGRFIIPGRRVQIL